MELILTGVLHIAVDATILIAAGQLFARSLTVVAVPVRVTPLGSASTVGSIAVLRGRRHVVTIETAATFVTRRLANFIVFRLTAIGATIRRHRDQSKFLICSQKYQYVFTEQRSLKSDETYRNCMGLLL